MIPTVTLFQSDKQIISRVDLSKNSAYDLIAPSGFNTTATVIQGTVHLKDRSITPYTAARQVAGKTDRLVNRSDESASVIVISTPATKDERCTEPFVRELKECQMLNPANGEFIWELEGLLNGSCKTHSVAIVIILPGHCSARHFHPKEFKGVDGTLTEGIEESYYVVSGEATLELAEETYALKPRDFKAIPPEALHKIYSIGNTPLVLYVSCARAWAPNCGTYVE